MEISTGIHACVAASERARSRRKSAAAGVRKPTRCRLTDAAGGTSVSLRRYEPRHRNHPMARRGNCINTMAALVFIVAGAACAQRGAGRLPEHTIAKAIAAYPHDIGAFTQGLAIQDGRLYESTGQYGRSSLRRVDLATGGIENISRLTREYFAEGIAIVDDRIYQLTWQNGIGIVYDRNTFATLGTFRYEGEGWGLTYDGTHLVLSDGSANLRFLDKDTFDVVRTVQVNDASGPVVRLNELEYIDGEVWANIWYRDVIVRIDPASGVVLGTIDVSTLYASTLRDREEVANGIAYDADAGKIYLTGKNWPQLYEVVLEPAP
jgi:glutamine cyclotransferase